MIVDPFELPPMAVTAAAGDAAAPNATTYVGPFDREAWPARLAAHVVSPDPDPRLHGYAVAGDLARFYGAIDVTWLVLRGELPTAAERAAFDAAMVLLAPVGVGEAPTHAAGLARIAGAPPAATIAISAVGLGEQARAEREAMADWWAWLDAPTAAIPACATGAAEAPATAAAPESREAQAARRWLDGQLRSWFGADRGLPDQPLTRLACGHAILHRLGLRGAVVLETVLVWARLPTVMAEAAAVRIGDVRGYPARLPDYQYADAEGAAP